MTDDQHVPPDPSPELPCNAVVFRVAASKKWIDEENRCLTPAAYHLRPADDRYPAETGISVGMASFCSAEVYALPEHCGLNKVHAVATHHVGRVRTIKLDVIQDEPNHGEILGLADLGDDERYHHQVLLSEQSRIQWPERFKWSLRTEDQDRS